MPRDLYQDVTDKIVRQLETGTRPWSNPWAAETAGAMPRRVTGQRYRGINVLLLWAASMTGGYRSSTWMTFKQAIALGGAVRKGEKGTGIVFFKQLTVADRADPTGESEKRIPMLRGYTVFNVDQIDGLPERFQPAARPALPYGPKQRAELQEAALRSSGADIRESGDQAFYVPAQDYVNLPTFDRFHTAGGYLATLAHELCHWTGHPSRLDRQQRNAFGSKDYAFEELVAEIGAAFVGARLGIVGEHIDNHAAYVASWLKALRSDKKMIFKAASLAQLAADLVLAGAGLDDDEIADQPAEAEGEAASPAPISAPAPMPAAQFALAL